MRSADPTGPADPLDGTRWAGWRREALSGDASSRAYWRLHGKDGARAILMDNGAPDANGFPAFRAIADLLSRGGLVTPEVLHVSDDRRFAVISDLGETTLAARIDAAHAGAPALYSALVEVLDRLSGIAPPAGLSRLTPETGADMLSPLFDHAAGPVSPRLRRDVESRLTDAMGTLCDPPDTLSLRDFHAENVIWRPMALGTDRFGLLDFQDAFVAPAEYDLASLLRDVRRDVPPQARRAATEAFARRKAKPVDAVARACAVLGVQRNLRILGIFARLIARDNKPRYRAFLPRTIRLIREDLGHPALGGLAVSVSRVLDGISA